MKDKKKHIVQVMGHESLPSSSSDLTTLLSAAPSIPFTPGVPTEDGWYVVKVAHGYEIVTITNGELWAVHKILSHAKLPEL